MENFKEKFLTKKYIWCILIVNTIVRFTFSHSIMNRRNPLHDRLKDERLETLRGCAPARQKRFVHTTVASITTEADTILKQTPGSAVAADAAAGGAEDDAAACENLEGVPELEESTFRLPTEGWREYEKDVFGVKRMVKFSPARDGFEEGEITSYINDDGFEVQHFSWKTAMYYTAQAGKRMPTNLEWSKIIQYRKPKLRRLGSCTGSYGKGRQWLKRCEEHDYWSSTMSNPGNMEDKEGFSYITKVHKDGEASACSS